MAAHSMSWKLSLPLSSSSRSSSAIDPPPAASASLRTPFALSQPSASSSSHLKLKTASLNNNSSKPRYAPLTQRSLFPNNAHVSQSKTGMIFSQNDRGNDDRDYFPLSQIISSSSSSSSVSASYSRLDSQSSLSQPGSQSRFSSSLPPSQGSINDSQNQLINNNHSNNMHSSNNWPPKDGNGANANRNQSHGHLSLHANNFGNSFSGRAAMSPPASIVSDNGALLPGVSDGVDAIRKKLDSLNGDIADLVRTQLTRAHESMLATFNEMFENQTATTITTALKEPLAALSQKGGDILSCKALLESLPTELKQSRAEIASLKTIIESTTQTQAEISTLRSALEDDRKLRFQINDYQKSCAQLQAEETALRSEIQQLRVEKESMVQVVSSLKNAELEARNWRQKAQEAKKNEIVAQHALAEVQSAIQRAHQDLRQLQELSTAGREKLISENNEAKASSSSSLPVLQSSQPTLPDTRPSSPVFELPELGLASQIPRPAPASSQHPSVDRKANLKFLCLSEDKEMDVVLDDHSSFLTTMHNGTDFEDLWLDGASSPISVHSSNDSVKLVGMKKLSLSSSHSSSSSFSSSSSSSLSSSLRSNFVKSERTDSIKHKRKAASQRVFAAEVLPWKSLCTTAARDGNPGPTDQPTTQSALESVSSFSFPSASSQENTCFVIEDRQRSCKSYRGARTTQVERKSLSPNHLEREFWCSLVATNQINIVETEELRVYLASHQLSTDGRRPALIRRVMEHVTAR